MPNGSRPSTLHRRMSAIANHRVLTPVLGVGVAAGVSALVMIGDPTTPGGFLPPCPTNALLHVNCPGCGSTRALYSLLHGDVPAALHYNALGVIAMVLIVVAFVMHVVGLWRGRKLRSWQHLRYTPWIALAVTAVWFVIRNLPFAPFSDLKV
ncbi:DUF2752 domain-containing protein [Gordonia malaquae]|uniref:DUF2752 domain-containing protein n=1 Tax=Gordonia malaquae TaxID=410332 RepID=UPI0030FE583D